MGLRLFQAPVESDVDAKSTGKSAADPANARSPIRRAERRRQLNETQAHRLHLLAALRNEASFSESAASEPRQAPSTDGPPSADISTQPVRGSDAGWDSLTDQVLRAERRMRRAATRPASSFPGPDALVGDDAYLTERDSSAAPGRRRSNRETVGSIRRLRELPFVVGRLRSPVIRRQNSFESAPSNQSPRASHPDPGEYLNEYRRRRNLQDGITRPRRSRAADRYVRYMDGLGDRDRSLSPEGDSIWDNLQSTLTPDPQPPSVGSSFASNSVSAAASQTTASSSNTSVTNPDEEAEVPCDPVGENAESSGEGEDDPDQRRTEPPRRSTPHGGRRSYAEVVAETLPLADDDASDGLQWLSDMQQIVQGLAAREDIPDRWWAAAGLSRSMTWDETN